MKQFTRNERRRIRRNSDHVAAVLAAGALTPDGRFGTVADPAARRVLRRAFAAMIRNDCKPIVRPITVTEAAALPGYRPPPPGATWWLAAGLDVDGRGTWVTNFARVTGLPEHEAREMIEVRMLADLAGACNVSGLPAEGSQ